jgi:hypothetical protein
VPQAALRGDADAVQTWAQRHPHQFAGMWFENEEDSVHPVRSRLGVGVVGDVGGLDGELRELVAHPEALLVVGMRWTDAQLDAFREQIVDELLPTSSLGDGVIGVGADTIGNRVKVQLVTRNDRLAAEIVGRYGIEVVVVENPPPGVTLKDSAV